MGGYYRGYHPGARISDLMLRQGDIQAEGAARSGAIWGNTIGNLGQIASSAIGQYAEQSAQKEQAQALAIQDAAATREILTWDGKDPKALLKGLMKVKGPVEGPKLAESVLSFNALTGKADEKNIERLKTTGKSLAAAPYPMFEQLYPALQTKKPELEELLGVTLPDAPTPELHEYVKQLFGSAPEPFTLSPGQQRFGPDGKPIAAVPEAPQKPPNLQTVETAEGIRTFNPQTGEMGPVIGRPKPSAGPGLQEIETIDPVTGKAVTKFVTPKAGESYPKPTGAAKPSTGQQRRALSFFNRGKEADDIAAGLEEAGKVNPTGIKAAQKVPFGAGNFALGEDNQKYVQAQRAFTEARLRKDSGASIKDSEYEEDAQTYFEQPGDGPQVKAQKRAMRKAVLAGIALESGDALKEFFGEEAEGMVEMYRRFSNIRGSAKANPFRR